MPKPTRANHGREWTPAEDALLAELATAGVPVRPIAKALSRTPHAVHSRASLIAVSLPRTTPERLRAATEILAAREARVPHAGTASE
jgi:hypothetical protein